MYVQSDLWRTVYGRSQLAIQVVRLLKRWVAAAMKWQYYTLKDSDPLGIELIRKNLSAGATNVLSQKLLTRLSDVTGSMLAVGLEKMDIGQMRTYSYATY